MKKYNIIYADPAWHFSSKELQKYDGERFRPLDVVYENHPVKNFKSLNIREIANKDCALFMWTTDAHIPDALQLIKAWGFKYITIAFIWEKLSKNKKTVCNLGAWTMKNCEICLLSTKGQMLKYKKCNNIRQLHRSERTAHSKKPDLFADLIVDLFGDLPRIELFARDKKIGWDCWGNEIESDIKL